MKETGYCFTSPALGEPISAGFRSAVARCENRKVFVVFCDKEEEVITQWYLTKEEAKYKAMKADDLSEARKLGDELWEKTEALRELQKVAACSGRFDIVDYISSVFNAARYYRGW